MCTRKEDVIMIVFFYFFPRIIRDRESQVGKGFAYVTFVDQKSVNSALKLHNKPFNKRKLRVLVCGKRFKDKKVTIAVNEIDVGRPQNRNKYIASLCLLTLIQNVNVLHPGGFL